MSLTPSVELIRKAATELEHTARSLRRDAEELERTGDLTIMGEALSTILHVFNNIRVDLFISYPIREITREKEKRNRT